MSDVFDDLAKAYSAGLRDGRSEAAEEIERLREALQFIADNWRNANVDMDAFYWKARAALGEGKE
jgi:hypothetical protein